MCREQEEVEEREPEPKLIKSKSKKQVVVMNNIVYPFLCVLGPPVVAKSTIVLEVKPWSTETGKKLVRRVF